jgi:hypothetical protein
MALSSDPVKFELFVRYCSGINIYDSQQSITRVEFRLWRDVLREIGINTVSDLYVRENDLVKWLTSEWFRILSHPKVRGHENTASVHSVWQKVIKLFDFYFSNAKKENGHLFESKPIEINRDERISCNPESLEKQGLGCLSKAIALRYGAQLTHHSLETILSLFVNRKSRFMFDRVNDNAKRLQIMKGVILGDDDVITWNHADEIPPIYEYDCSMPLENRGNYKLS